jgi:hypothetical protein
MAESSTEQTNLGRNTFVGRERELAEHPFHRADAG